MISIITCSRAKDISTELRKNIVQTIGIEHEIIVFDNSANKHSIFQAYNIGASRAKYEILCFVHDDLFYMTQDWGKKLLKHFEDSEIGLIGVAGARFKSKYNSGWGCSHKRLRANVQETSPDGTIKKMYFNPNNTQLEDVVCIDGIFMATRKAVWDENHFDEITFSGFHCYDLDFSFQVKRKHKVCVCFDINVNHHANASYNSKWLTASKILHNKWQNSLPMSVDAISNEEIKYEDWYVNKTYCNTSIESNERMQALGFYANCLKILPFKFNNLVTLFRIIGGKSFSQFLNRWIIKLSK